MTQCSSCEQTSKIRNYRKDDKEVVYCRRCAIKTGAETKRDQNARDRQTRRRKRLEIIAKLRNSPCSDCTKSFNPWLVEFDHIDGGKTKRANIGSLISHRSLKFFTEELAKTQHVCGNCHRTREYIREVFSKLCKDITILSFREIVCEDCKVQWPHWIIQPTLITGSSIKLILCYNCHKERRYQENVSSRPIV